MRKKIVAGNWKMHGTRDEAHALIEAIKQGSTTLSNVEVILLPSFVHLQQTETLLKNTSIALGAQNLYLGAAGAYTGEVSGQMLSDYGCHYVLVGHSERRTLFAEDLNLVSEKFKAAQKANLQPILCIGETLAQREQNQTENIIQQQLASVIENASIDAFRRTIIAYEPVWAIGTGLTASPDQAQEVHAFIRKQLAKHSVEVAETVRILYGGSVKADNAAALFSKPDIDGGLVGGASLNAESFLAICRA